MSYKSGALTGLSYGLAERRFEVYLKVVRGQRNKDYKPAFIAVYMIIGITGPICAGKDEAGKILAKRGFERLSLVEEIREELRRRGTEITRKNLQDLGDALRHSEGVDALARRVMKKIIPGRHYTIESIRNPGEVQALRALYYFILFFFSSS